MKDTSPHEVDTAVRAAYEAFHVGRHVDLSTRASWLEAIADGLARNEAALVAIADRETSLGKPRLESELRRSIFQLELFAGEIRQGEHLDATIDHSDPHWGMGPRPDLRRVNQPVGVVGVFGASNFPFAFSVMGGDSASALAAGCSVVHKAHEAHPDLAEQTAQTVAAALESAGAPPGLFSLVAGRTAGENLVDHPLIKAVGFTGSTAGGRALLQRAQSRPEPIPFYGELGGINAVFVTTAAWQRRRESILKEYVNSFTLGMGQFCTKPGLLFVPATGREELRRLLSEALSGFTPIRLLSSGILEGYERSVTALRDQSEVDVLVEGTFAPQPAPTVLHTTGADVLAQPELLRQEMFGPASLVIEYEDDMKLPDLAGLLEGQLTTTLQTEPDETPTNLLEVLAGISGRVLWNGWPTGVTVSYAQHHGGPYPATTSNTTSVGTAAIRRFLRPVSYQSFPPGLLPEPLRDENPWRVPQRIDGRWDRPGQS
ncbi:aldehyde dehydrogenase (NADP(+)) [Sinomonas notoginsengisoli]|uniref:aldehyde dehydrogenase (NADP(+)) n=1 Tax=Sinomonas notoginsengisoli TaxID=1457311 RepID=UPI001F341EB5|nr:aldehyde dehydrogenase (NADP(+)) [Sinomonas notoginsengisoli]